MDTILDLKALLVGDCKIKSVGEKESSFEGRGNLQPPQLKNQTPPRNEMGAPLGSRDRIPSVSGWEGGDGNGLKKS